MKTNMCSDMLWDIEGGEKNEEKTVYHIDVNSAYLVEAVYRLKFLEPAQTCAGFLLPLAGISARGMGLSWQSPSLRKDIRSIQENPFLRQAEMS